jgi:CII-binding regulator of phage lambda lysogenization HflD
MAPPLSLPQTLEELATKQQEDQDAMIATLNSLFEKNQTARDECTEDRATLKNIAETLQKLQGQLTDTTQQQRTQNLAIL